ncbi:Sodium/potassium-transporting ATPase subunit beta-2 isoform 1 [Schistosoma japonicum]|uniref:Nervana 2 n=2 Tax=Schistosoma japonicum TaxID=6182 RepID=C1L6D1_SCHJA|nr:Sodium/potassium-transporting ATPase subunit beta-2 isoform 1 [Schistosoma japonicum]CAX70259.1 nervana 2 [Schistosoma japonicum]
MSMQEFSDNLSTLSYMSRHRIPTWIYDSKNKTLFGRTLCSWTLCILFYLIYYACLATFFTCLLWLVLYCNVPENQPARTGMQSLLDFKPGLGFRPLLDVQKSLISYSSGDSQTYLPYTQNMDAYLDTYIQVNAKPDSQFASCEGKQGETKDVDKVCKFPLEKLGPCTSRDNFGYSKGSPCVLLKVNKVFGWMPSINNPSASNDILVSCSGQNPADEENIGALGYYPSVTISGKQYGVFSSAYYPFLGQAGYLGPLVAVEFKSPKKSVAILVKCTLSNVKNANKDDLNFEIMVD